MTFSSSFAARSGPSTHLGKGKGLGYTVNIPLPAGSGEGAYNEAWTRFALVVVVLLLTQRQTARWLGFVCVFFSVRIVVPRVNLFAPDIILVSCGFNASAMDPMARMMLSSAAYVRVTSTSINNH
jgi:acetoin utilization deacetylase AcuC-like enzyme